ncbi:MAG TPA: hypothetical protein P5218_00835 [Planctomycetota bacterium]|nr:hypothetical protein [Planctomycetota bacterium]HRV79943.1 hypothetical protein [Planctomycetota bacterium]
MADWIRFFLAGPGALFTLYIALQVASVALLRGAWRWISLIPLPFLAYAVLATIDAYHAESNLWPLALMGASAAGSAALALLILWRWLWIRRNNKDRTTRV